MPTLEIITNFTVTLFKLNEISKSTVDHINQRKYLFMTNSCISLT